MRWRWRKNIIKREREIQGKGIEGSLDGQESEVLLGKIDSWKMISLEMKTEWEFKSNFIPLDIKGITNEDTPPRPRIKFSPSGSNGGSKALTTKHP